MMKYSKALSVNKKIICVALTAAFLTSACGEDATSTSGEYYVTCTHTGMYALTCGEIGIPGNQQHLHT